MNKMAIVTLQSALNKAAKTLGLEDKMQQNQIGKVWEEIYGEKIASVQNFKNGTLYLQTKSTTWRFELELRKDAIIEQINSKLEQSLVKILVIK